MSIQCWKAMSKAMFSFLEHQWNFPLDLFQKWRWCWDIWSSGDDSEFFFCQWGKIWVKARYELEYCFRNLEVYLWSRLSSFWISQNKNRDFKGHVFQSLSVKVMIVAVLSENFFTTIFKTHGRFPRCFRDIIAFPFNIVLVSSALFSMIENSFDFPLFFIIVDIWRGSKVVVSVDFSFCVRH